MTTSLGALIQQILPLPATSVEVLLRQLTPHMTPTIDSLINQLITLKPAESAAKTSAITAGVIEAIVLSSTLLKNTQSHQVSPAKDSSTKYIATQDNPNQPINVNTNKANPTKNTLNSQLAANNRVLPIQTTDLTPLFKIKVTTQQHSIELISQSPVPPGSRIQLSIAANNVATIVTSSEPSKPTAQPNVTADTRSNTHTINAVVSKTTPLQTPTATITTADNQNLGTLGNNIKLRSHSAASTQPITTENRPNPTKNSALSEPSNQAAKRLVIEQALRSVLPQQQPLRNLVSLLQKIVVKPPAHWPAALNNNLKVLLQQFPSAEQVQQPNTLKQAIHNTGLFFEAKLAQSVNGTTRNTTQASNNNPTANLTSNINNQIKGDIKGLLQRIIAQVSKVEAQNQTASTIPPASTTTGTPSPPTSTIISNPSSHSPDELKTSTPPIYTEIAGQKLDIQLGQAKTSTDNSNNSDVLLRQLSQQLLAGLARSQTHQLDSLISRQQQSGDNQAPTNSWTLEIPISQGKHHENLELRIAQYDIEQENQQGEKSSKKLWTVMLNFDLHSLGKMNVELRIIDQSVSATVWSQQENTYCEVKRQVNNLKDNLEKVGVSVTKVQCQLGEPPKNIRPLYEQLVDIRT